MPAPEHSRPDSPPTGERPASPVPTMEELVLLNDELAALARSGVGLEAGLGPLAASGGRLGAVAAEIRSELESGKSLEEAVPLHDDAFGRTYRAVVAAGLRCGRLSDALEAFARTGRSVIRERRALQLGLMHPWIVLGLVFLFVTWFVVTMAPEWLALYRNFGLEPPRLLTLVAGTFESMGPLWWGIPAAMLGLVVWSWWAGRRGRLGPLAAIPYVAKSARESRLATYFDLIALQAEHGVPLPVAVPLAGEACGDARVAEASRRLGETLQAGRSAAESFRETTALPRFARTVLAIGAKDQRLAAAAAEIATTCRRRASRRMTWVRTVVPVVLTVVVAGGAVLSYALMLWLPFTTLMRGLS